MTYRVELIRSENGYSVACPDLPGCASQGATEDQAISKLRNILGDYLHVKKQGDRPREVRFIEVDEQPAKTSLNRKPFKVKPFMMNLPKEWTSGKVEDLLDILEGPDRRW